MEDPEETIIQRDEEITIEEPVVDIIQDIHVTSGGKITTNPLGKQHKIHKFTDKQLQELGDISNKVPIVIDDKTTIYISKDKVDKINELKQKYSKHQQRYDKRGSSEPSIEFVDDTTSTDKPID